MCNIIWHIDPTNSKVEGKDIGTVVDQLFIEIRSFMRIDEVNLGAGRKSWDICARASSNRQLWIRTKSYQNFEPGRNSIFPNMSTRVRHG